MSGILLKNVMSDGKVCDVRIAGNRFAGIGNEFEKLPGEEVLDGKGSLGIFPAFYNNHTHAAMTLFRGYADDLELFDWLSNHIWPAEAKLDPEMVYWGTMLSIVEMIRSGTVFFNDMYWAQMATIRAAEDMKIRAAAGLMFIDGAESSPLIDNAELAAKRGSFSSRIRITLAPHAVYTVGEKNLRRVAEMAAKEDYPIQIHVAETAKEVEDCVKAHGMTPVAYLDKLGLLNEKTVMAHCVHLSNDDMKIIAGRGSVISHCPSSNFKLVSGRFPFRRATEEYRCRVSIGTDGVSSNNSASMFSEMKFASLGAKLESGDPTAAPADLVFDAATRAGAEANGIDAGKIEVGKLADCMLIDLDTVQFSAGHHPVADLVYAAESCCVHSVICDGAFLMKDRVVPEEKTILKNFRKELSRLLAKL